MINPFTQHPNQLGETYFQHLKIAMKFSFNCAYASVTLFIHSIFPFLFRTTGSRIITKLFQTMVKQRMENGKENNSGKKEDLKSEILLD